MAKKKHALSFEEFLTEKRKEQNKPGNKIIDWDKKRDNWLKAIDNLYSKVDKLIVGKFEKVGYNIATEKEEIRLTEDYIGSYITYNYIVKADKFKIRFCPVSSIMIQHNGRVDMIMPRGTVKLILTDENKWTIAERFSVPFNLVEFNEKNIQKVFESYL